MKIIGLTGGIGSGKTTVAKVFESFGIPVYYADPEAHKIRSKPENQQAIVEYFGLDICSDGKLDKQKLAQLVFNDEKALSWLNNLLHPQLTADFRLWVSEKSKQNQPYAIMEAAILFEAGFDKLFDKVISVYAPSELCFERLRKRNNYVSDADIMQRLKNQMPPEQKAKKADFVIYNDEKKSVLEQVLGFHRTLVFL